MPDERQKGAWRRAVGESTRRSVAREVDDELAFHLDMRVRQLVATGMTEPQARLEAQRQFGDVERVRASCVTYDQERLATMRRTTMLDELRQDLGYAFRTMRRSPLFAATVCLIIAIGIGANAAIFSLVNAVMLRRLPVRAPQELVVIGDPGMVGGVAHATNAYAGLYGWTDYRALRERNSAYTDIAASGRADRLQVRTASGQSEADAPRGRFVSGNYFDVLGVGTMVGRTFDASADAVVGGAPVVTISHAYWQRKFGGDPDVVGRDLIIDGARFTILGVTRPGFTGEVVGQAIDLWIPATMQAVVKPARPWLTESDARWLHLIARRRPGVSLAQASERTAADVRAILSDRHSLSDAERAELEVPVSDGSRGLSRMRVLFAAPLVILLCGVGVLLLIICANVANLLLARAMARGREMSVRLAIGAGRGRLVRQLLTESLVLGMAGAAGGLLLARWASQALLAMATSGLTVASLDTGVDLTVVGFTAALSLMAVILFGLVPALRTSRVDLASALRASARTSRGTGGRWSAGNVLIAAQVAMSLVLVLGASLLGTSLRNIQRAETGLDHEHIAVIEVDATTRGVSGDELVSLTERLADAMRRVPGVAAVTWSENGLFSGTNSATSIVVPGFVPARESEASSNYDQIGPGFVSAIGGRLLRGRDFTAQDLAARNPVVVVNEAFVKLYFADRDPIGQSFSIDELPAVQIVGVMSDVRDATLTEAVKRRFYLPWVRNAIEAPGNVAMIVRTTGEPALAMPQLRRAVESVDPLLPITDADPLTTLMSRSVSEQRLLTQLSAGFGLFSLLLASLGLYGVMTYAVTRRTGEMGLRSALGSRPSTVAGLVLRDAMRLVATGLAIGLPLGLAAVRALETQLVGVSPRDATAVVIAIGALSFSAALAAFIPAVRAARVSPLVALQQE